jgi:hypothetical protein
MQSALGRSVPRETIKSFGREIPYSSKQIPCSFLCREFRVQGDGANRNGGHRWSNIESVRNSDSRATEIVTVHQYESGVSQPRRATLDVIRRAFESAGVEFRHLRLKRFSRGAVREGALVPAAASRATNGTPLGHSKQIRHWSLIRASGPINVEIVDYH